MNTELFYPVSIYYYQRHIKKDGTTGTRWDYVRHEGKEQPDLFFVSAKGVKLIYLGPQKNKERKPGAPENYLRWNKLRPLIKNGKTILTNNASGVFEPKIKNPGYGFGEINNNRDKILIRKTESDMMIMVFENLGNAEELYKQWMTGAVRECIPSNNVMLDTETVQAIPV